MAMKDVPFINFGGEKYVKISLLKEAEGIINRLSEENRRLKMDQYKYKCSGCGHFFKFHQRTCPNCQRTNYFTGSFKQEDLEDWLREMQEI
jgi:rubrerythrin